MNGQTQKIIKITLLVVTTVIALGLLGRSLITGEDIPKGWAMLVGTVWGALLGIRELLSGVREVKRMQTIYTILTELLLAVIAAWAVYTIIVIAGKLVFQGATWRDVALALGGIFGLTGGTQLRPECSLYKYTPGMALGIWAFALAVFSLMIFAFLRKIKG